MYDGFARVAAVQVYVLYLYGPMIKFLEGDLGWVVILAIVELIFYIHGEGEWRVARASASLEEQTWTRT
jgi:hypothetical protein